MHYFPLYMDIRGRKVVIVGGGAVAARKCIALLEAEASVHVIAPEIAPSLRELQDANTISVVLREYCPGDVAGAVLAFAATDSEEVNRAVAAEAASHGIPVNVATPPDAGTFIMPASVHRGDLLLTVSTGGRSPLLSAEVRRSLAAQYGPEYGPVVALLGAIREKLLTEKEGSAYNKGLLRVLTGHNLPELFKNDAFSELDRLLLELFGPGFSLAELGVRDKDSQ